MKQILFSLQNCVKCTQTKEILKDRNDIEIITLPHEIDDWNEKDHNIVNKYNVYNDLIKTAPILCVNEKKVIGYLRIRKWINEN